jgi:hypothetical protein
MASNKAKALKMEPIPHDKIAAAPARFANQVRRGAGGLGGSCHMSDIQAATG